MRLPKIQNTEDAYMVYLLMDYPDKVWQKLPREFNNADLDTKLSMLAHAIIITKKVS